MAGLTVFGGGGYAGSHIVEAAAVRGMEVTSITRTEVATQIANVRYRQGSLTDPAVRAHALSSGDTILIAASPRGAMADVLRGAIADFAAEADNAGVRLGVIGGSGSLIAEPGGPRLFEMPGFGQEYLAEARTMSEVLDDLLAAPSTLDWFMVCPPGDFGPWAAGTFRDEYRVSDDVVLVDSEGKSAISGADFGVAVVDEVEMPAHRRRRFTVAY